MKISKIEEKMNKIIEPYRILFPVGILFGVWGTAVWISYWLGFIDFPSRIHSDLMMSGFMFSFISGFLMTSMPKYLGSKKFLTVDLFIISFILMGLFFSAVFELRIIFQFLSFLGMLYLGYFVIFRFFNRTHQIYPNFIYLIVGLLFASVGTGILFFSDILKLDFQLIRLAKLFFYQGTIISLIVGVGSTLIPVLLGYGNQNVISYSVGERSLFQVYLQSVTGIIWLFLFLFISSFFIEIYVNYIAGTLLRALVISQIIIKTWKIFQFPFANSKLSVSIWITGVMLILSLWISVFFYIYKVHAIHMLFISGFGLLTILVASRITLAHGYHGFHLEVNSNLLYYLTFLIILAALTRFSAIFFPEFYTEYLAYAGILWVFALLVWAGFFLKKLIFIKQ
jgi:hypothetical protein